MNSIQITDGIKVVDVCKASVQCGCGDSLLACGSGTINCGEQVRFRYCLSDCGDTITNADQVQMLLVDGAKAEYVKATIIDPVDNCCVYADARILNPGSLEVMLAITRSGVRVLTQSKTLLVY